MLFANARLVAARIELTLHRAEQITDINDASIASKCLVKVCFLEVMVGVGVIVVAVPGQQEPPLIRSRGAIEIDEVDVPRRCPHLERGLEMRSHGWFGH